MFLLPVITTIVVCLVVFSKSVERAKVTSTDIAIAVYLLYALFNLIFIREITPDIFMLLGWGMYLCLYIAARNITNKYPIVWFIIGIGTIQALIGIAQLCGWIPSNHQDFPVTGTFPNPGPYGGFLAVSLIATTWMLRAETRQKVLLWMALLLVLGMLIVSNSRAAWVAVFVGIVTQLPVIRKRWTKITLLFAVCALVGGLYFYRPASADARILIWNVCARLIENHPVTGVGVGTLPLYYMNAQAEFFANNPNSELSVVANNNYQAFNEFIHLCVEQGMIGLLLLLSVIFTCCKSSCFPIILTWSMFAMFSYPADLPLFMIVFVLSISLCSSGREIISFKFNKKWLLCSLVIIPLIVMMNLKYHKAIQNIGVSAIAEFPNNREYMLRFAKQKQDVIIFEKLTKNICSSTDILCDMGDAYKICHEIKRADSCYSLARQMVPCRIIPLHKLYLLYKQTDSTRAKVYATQILDFKFRVVGSAVLRARADAKKYLNYE